MRLASIASMTFMNCLYQDLENPHERISSPKWHLKQLIHPFAKKSITNYCLFNGFKFIWIHEPFCNWILVPKLYGSQTKTSLFCIKSMKNNLFPCYWYFKPPALIFYTYCTYTHWVKMRILSCIYSYDAIIHKNANCQNKINRLDVFCF